MRVGPATGVLYTVLGVLLQLLGGTVFAVGLLGEGVLAIRRWIERYLNFTREPLVSLAPLVIIVNLLTLTIRDRSPTAREVVDFAAIGVCVLLAVTQIARFMDVPSILSSAHAAWVRGAYVFIGFVLYYIGTRVVSR